MTCRRVSPCKPVEGSNEHLAVQRTPGQACPRQLSGRLCMCVPAQGSMDAPLPEKQCQSSLRKAACTRCISASSAGCKERLLWASVLNWGWTRLRAWMGLMLS